MTRFHDPAAGAILPASRVLEMDGRAGLPAPFATSPVVKVYCMSTGPEPDAAGHLRAIHDCGARSGSRHGRGFEGLPPEPVDLVICDRPSTGTTRDGQSAALHAFKLQYRARFGERLPVFMPAATLLTVQPVHQDYAGVGFPLPIIGYGDARSTRTRTGVLASPVICGVIDDLSPAGRGIRWQGLIGVNADGVVNALRFGTRNIGALLGARTAERQVGHLILALPSPVSVQAGDTLRATFDYRCGGSLQALARTLHVQIAARVCPRDDAG